jgi:hypothetical protein
VRTVPPYVVPDLSPLPTPDRRQQSLVSVYLVALAILTYPGTPFEY